MNTVTRTLPHHSNRLYLTDGGPPTGQSPEQAIAEIDAATDRAPACYMINCAHPDHFRDAIAADAEWLARIRGWPA